MNIRRVIKFYFSFVMVLVSAAGLSYNDDVRALMINSFNIEMGAEKDLFTIASDKVLLSEALATGISGQGIFSAVNANSEALSFEMEHDADRAFANPGAAGAEIMRFEMNTYESSLHFSALTLKVFGVDAEDVQRAVLVMDEENFIEGSREGEYFVFKNIDYKLDANSDGIVSLQVDLGEELTTGNRLRLDIEKPDDIELYVGGKVYKINEYYPIEGKYLSITKQNPSVTKTVVVDAESK